MSVGRISGPLLKDNLLRNGANLAFETSLLYLDVVNSRIGISNSNPAYQLDVTGTSRTTSLLATTATVNEVYISTNIVSSTFGNLNLTANSGQSIVVGTVGQNNDVLINGSLHATGGFTVDGNTIVGTNSTNTVAFNSSVSTDFIPDNNNQRSLGASGKTWASVYTTNLYTTTSAFGNIQISGNTILATNTDGVITLTPNGVGNVNVNSTLASTAYNNGSLVVGGGVGIAGAIFANSTLSVAGHVTLEGVTSTGATGTGKLVFGTSPEFTTSVTTASTSFDLFNTSATTVNAFGAATTVAIGATGSTTTVTLGGANTGNTLKIAGTASGTTSLTTDVTTGIVNLAAGVTTGTVNIATGGASTVNIGGTGSTTVVKHLTVEGVTSSGATGTTNIVFSNSPTLITPALGAATATSINGLTISTTTGTLTIANGKTLTASNTLTFTGTDGSNVAFSGGGTVTYTSNKLSVFAATTSAELAGVISDETGTGYLVFSASPTLTGTLSAANGTFSGTLDVTGDFAVNTNKFTVAASTGNTAVAGTLNVTGLSTLATAKVSNLTSGRVVLAGTSGTIQDSGNLTFDGTLLTVTGNQKITGNLGVDGNITLGGNIQIGDNVVDTVTVTADFTSDLIPQVTNTYNLGSSSYRWKQLFANTLDVSGASTLSGNTTVGGTLGVTNDFSVNTNKFTVAASTGNTLVAGTLNVTGHTTFEGVTSTGATGTGNLVYSASPTFSGTLTAANITDSGLTAGRVTFAGVAGALTDSASLTFSSGTLTVGTSVVVSGTAGDITMTGGNITGVLGITATGTISAAVIKDSGLTSGRLTYATTNGQLTDSSNLTFDGTQLTTNALSVTNNALVGGTLGVTSSFSVNTNKFTVASATGNTAVAGTLNVTGHVTLEGVTSTGATGINKLVFDTNPTISGATFTNHVTVEGVTSAGATGTGNFVFDNTPTIVTPTISGHFTAEGVTTTGATGTGKLVFDGSPTLVTPTLGVASATTINKVTITSPATGSTLTIADGKTLTASNTLTFTGTDGSSVAFSSGGTVTYTSNKLSVFSATTSAELAGVLSDETGFSTGALAVFSKSPSIDAPTITGHPVVEGVTSTGATGTGNFVFSASPTFTGTVTLPAITATNITNSALTSGRVVYSTTAGLETDSANLTFNGTTLTANALAVTAGATVGTTLDVTGLSTLATAKVSNLTSGRVVLAGTTGTIQDSGNLTFNGTKLTVTGDQDITGNLKVDGNISLGGNITIGDNVLDTVTVTADFTSDLIPQATNTYNLGSSSYRWKKLFANALDVSGTTVLGNLQLSGNTIQATNTDGGVTLTANGTGYVSVSGSGAFLIPAGNTTARPGTPAVGMIRYNNQLTQFEGYSSGNWSSLGGVRSVDGNAYIIAETSPGAADDTLHFWAGAITSTNVGNWTDTALTILSPGFRVPTGDTAHRPTGVDGYIRFNTQINKFEGYSNSNWSSLGGVSSVNGTTYIGAEAYPGAGDNTLYFYANGILQLTIDPTKADFKNLVNVSDTTNSVSTSTGSIVTAGGVGIAKSLYVGQSTNIAGAFTATNAVNMNPANNSISIQPTGTGSVTIKPALLGAIDNMTVGGVTPAAGTFTNLTVNTSASLSPSGTVTINPTTQSTMDNVSIGSTTRAPGAFTTLTSNGLTTFTDTTQSSSSASGAVVITGGVGIGKNLNVSGNLDVTGTTTAESTFTANAAVNLNPANYTVSLQPTGTGTVTINPAVTGAMDNVAIGATTQSSAKVTTLTAYDNLTANTTNKNVTIGASTGSGTTTINSGTTGSIDNITIGATTASTGRFTTLTATTSATLTPSGTVTINPTTAGTIDNMSIGATTATTGKFTTLQATTSASLSPSGTVTINPSTTSNADNIIIGATVPKAGTFTNLTVNTSASLSPSGTVTINPGSTSSVDNVDIGANTRGSGAFTSLAANSAVSFTSTTDSSAYGNGAVTVAGGVGITKNLNVGGNFDVTGSLTAESTLTAQAAVNLNPNNNNVSLQPTGTGTVTVAPATTGAINNMVIGATTPKAATFTTLTTQGDVTLNGSDSVISLTPTGSGYVTINPGSAGTINKMSIGATTASTGKFTTLQATTSATFDTSGNVSIQPAGTVTINPTTTSSVDNVNIGANTRGSGAFTTLTSNDTVTFTSSTESTSTTSGALQVSGGVGIVKNLYVGGNTSIAGNLTVLGTTTSIQSTVTTLTDPVIAVGGLTDTGLVDAANRGVQTRYATDISSQVTSWTGDYSSSVVANLSVTAASLGFKIGDKINISGSGLANLDGVGTVTSVDSTTVTFTAPGNLAYGTAANIATVGLSKNGFFGYEPTSKKFVYIPDAIISSNVVTGNYGDAEFNSLTLVSALAVPQGGTGTTSFTTKGIVYGNGSSGLQVTAASDMGGSNATTSYGILTTDSSNTPVWTDVIDCGTY